MDHRKHSYDIHFLYDFHPILLFCHRVAPSGHASVLDKIFVQLEEDVVKLTDDHKSQEVHDDFNDRIICQKHD